MSEAIKNRYEFVVLFDVENGNPNGDPDAGNMPRVDPESGLGLVTDVCLKRKIRNYVETVKEDAQGYKIYIKEDVPLNRSDREACADMGITETDDKKVTEELKKLKKNDPGVDIKLKDYMCRNFYDIRTFGAVLTTFDVEGFGEYIALIPLDKNGKNKSGETFLFRYHEEDGNPVINNIEREDEYMAAAESFQNFIENLPHENEIDEELEEEPDGKQSEEQDEDIFAE